MWHYFLLFLEHPLLLIFGVVVVFLLMLALTIWGLK